MNLLWEIAAVAVYFGIIGVLLKDALEQYHGRKDRWKIERRRKRK